MGETKKITKNKTVKKEDPIKDVDNVKDVIKRKTKKELSLELRKKQDEIIVEISNISAMQCSYGNGSGDVYFDFLPGEFEELTLGELKEVSKMAKSFFSEYSIIITDVLNEDYSIDDIMEYLSLKNLYKDVEDKNEDFIRNILEYSDDKFEELINAKIGNKNFVRNVACKGVYLTKLEDDEYELSRRKEDVLSKALNRRSLINKD